METAMYGGVLALLLSLCILAFCLSAFFGVMIFKSLGLTVNDKRRIEAAREREEAEKSRIERSMAGKIMGSSTR